MSRRSSNAVKLAKSHATRRGVVLDRNGIPSLDDPSTNRLPRRCPSESAHTFWRVGRKFRRVDAIGRSVFEVEFRCVACGARAMETETEG